MKKCECMRIVPGCKTALLMIHGIMGKPSYFAPFLPLVPENMSLCNLLLDGHCGSLHDFCHSSMKKWRSQVFDILDTLLESHAQVIIFGYSLGALFAVEAAVKYPDRVRHIFCTCLPLLMRMPPAAKIRVWRIMFDKILPDTPTERMMDACGTQTTKKLWKYAGTAPRMAELVREMYRARAKMHQLTIPCRNYMGALDEMLSQRTHRYLEQFPTVTNVVLPHSGHFAIDSRDLPTVQADFVQLLTEMDN